MNYQVIRSLPTIEEVKKKYPLTDTMKINREKKLLSLTQILSGSSDRLILIIGPCSADNQDAMLEYATRLKQLSDKFGDRLFFIPRVYSSKPRSTGTGYKGLLHQPVLSEEENIAKGIIALRSIHHLVLQETGLITADEMLYSENISYIDDLIGYLALGARSSEDQSHRFAASASDLPCGIKNPTSGSLDSLLDSVSAVQSPQQFAFRGKEIRSNGNPFAHCVLRGYTDDRDEVHANYTEPFLSTLQTKYMERPFLNPAFLIDTNHSNSGKNWSLQPDIVQYILQLKVTVPKLFTNFKGFMIESYLEDGCQPLSGTKFGCSYTDPCLGFAKTEKLIEKIYRAQKKGTV